MTINLLSFWLLKEAANAAVNFTMSNGVRFCPGLPPIVPLIPEILFISATL
jgi:hypothetical protein